MLVFDLPDVIRSLAVMVRPPKKLAIIEGLNRGIRFGDRWGRWSVSEIF
jgi:hypothetical protein